jgi:methionine-rich copper-binding protein CopC
MNRTGTGFATRVRTLAVVLAAALILALGRSAPTLGHAVLTTTSLDGTTLRADSPTTVALHFNTAIEPGFTRVVLVNERREERALEILPPGEDRGEVRVAVPALPPGAYGLRFKVLAADGHVTERVVRFKVMPAQ